MPSHLWIKNKEMVLVYDYVFFLFCLENQWSLGVLTHTQGRYSRPGILDQNFIGIDQAKGFCISLLCFFVLVDHICELAYL